VRVIQRGHGASLTLKASQVVRIVCHRGRQDLDGNVTAQAWVTGTKYLAHPPGSDGTEDLILAEFVA
jgi:hypothetical protein